jgi:hypothetical protein
VAADIQAIAHHKAVGQHEALVGQGDVDQAAVGAIEQDADFEAGGVPGA